MPLFDPKTKAISALQKTIEDKKRLCENHYYKIGRLYYSQYKDVNTDVTKDINALCDAVSTLNREIKDCELKILFEKGLKLCPSCGKENNLEHAFCFSCGAKFAEDSSKRPGVSEETAKKADEAVEAAPVEAPVVETAAVVETVEAVEATDATPAEEAPAAEADVEVVEAVEVTEG